VSDLTILNVGFAPPGANQTSFSMAFDLAYPTQALFHRYLAANEFCDPPLVNTLLGFLQPGDTFIDVGSHIGYYSLFALQIVGAKGSVFAFEPNPNTFSVILASVLLNRAPNFFVLNCAMGDKPGMATFNINKQDEGMSSLVHRPANATQVSVQVTTLDAFAALARLGPVRMLKIDVEGFEENVVAGGHQLLSSGNVESVVFEINNNFPEIPKFRDQAIRKVLSSYGYTSYLIRPWMGEAQWQERCGKFNFLRIPDDRIIEIAYGNILATKRPIEAATL
jgi:FkbM family methyltransferase